MENSKERIIYYLIFILYVVLVFIIGYNHEPWADEAQSWLIARDNSFLDILFFNSRYEGHPFLWFYIEKLFINTHIASSVELYRWIFIIPLVFSAIGVYVFLFKSKFPLIIKCMVPFTFYIFYQGGVLARNHSLCFPLLAIIAVLYPKRFEHPYVYALLLFLTANTSAYTYLVALALFIFFIVDIVKEKIDIKKYIKPVIIIAFVLLTTAIILKVPNDNTSFLSLTKDAILHRTILVSSIFFPLNIENKVQAAFLFVLTILFYISVMRAYCKNLYQIIFFISLNLPLILFYMFVYIKPWHFGYAGIFLLFTCWLLSEMNDLPKIPFKKHWLLYIFITFIFEYYVIGNIQISFFDYKNNYDGAKEAAAFIKKYNLQKYKIIASDYKTVSIQPYFEENIFYNFTDKPHYLWKSDFFDRFHQRLEEYAPIYIAINHGYEIFQRELINDYKEFSFPGYMPVLNLTKSEDEINEYDIYINKKLLSKIPDLNNNN